MLLDNLSAYDFHDADVALFDEEPVTHASTAEDDEAMPGISFSIPEGFSQRECFILRQALHAMSDAIDPAQADLQTIFRRNEHRIHQIARRLMCGSRVGTPVIIGLSAVKQN